MAIQSLLFEIKIGTPPPSKTFNKIFFNTTTKKGKPLKRKFCNERKVNKSRSERKTGRKNKNVKKNCNQQLGKGRKRKKGRQREEASSIKVSLH